MVENKKKKQLDGKLFEQLLDFVRRFILYDRDYGGTQRFNIVTCQVNQIVSQSRVLHLSLELSSSLAL